MRVERKTSKRLAETANIINALNGGSILPRFNTLSEDNLIRLEVSAPSIDAENLKVQVNNGNLVVIQHVEVANYTLPNVLGMMQLSPKVDIDGITAEYEDQRLIVNMPLKESSAGFNREIEIHRPL